MARFLERVDAPTCDLSTKLVHVIHGKLRLKCDAKIGNDGVKNRVRYVVDSQRLLSATFPVRVLFTGFLSRLFVFYAIPNGSLGVGIFYFLDSLLRVFPPPFFSPWNVLTTWSELNAIRRNLTWAKGLRFSWGFSEFDCLLLGFRFYFFVHPCSWSLTRAERLHQTTSRFP